VLFAGLGQCFTAFMSVFVLRRPLAPSDDRAIFRSGDADLDRFFHRYAGQNQFRHHLGTIDVFDLGDDTCLVSYSTDAVPDVMALVIGGAAGAGLRAVKQRFEHEES
jgi:hypothetical protein